MTVVVAIDVGKNEFAVSVTDATRNRLLGPVMGRRTIKTDAVDLEAMTELLLAGRGLPVTHREVVLVEIAAWAGHRNRRVQIRTATKNQFLGQLDRSFPGLTMALPDLLGTKVGRLVAAQFPDPARLVALGASRFVRFAAHRGLRVQPEAVRFSV